MEYIVDAHGFKLSGTDSIIEQNMDVDEEKSVCEGDLIMIKTEVMENNENEGVGDFVILSGLNKCRQQEIAIEREGVVFRDLFLKTYFLISFRVWWELDQYLKQFYMTNNTNNVKPSLYVPQLVYDDVYVCTVQINNNYYLDIHHCFRNGNVLVPGKEGIRLSVSSVNELLNMSNEIEVKIHEKGDMDVVKQSLRLLIRGTVSAMVEWCEQKIRMFEFNNDVYQEEEEGGQAGYDSIIEDRDNVFTKVFEKMNEKEVRDIFFNNLGYNLPVYTYLETMIKYRGLVKRFVNKGDDPDLDPPHLTK